MSFFPYYTAFLNCQSGCQKICIFTECNQIKAFEIVISFTTIIYESGIKAIGR